MPRKYIILSLAFSILYWSCSDFYGAGVSYGGLPVPDTVKIHRDSLLITPQFSLHDTLWRRNFELRPQMTGVISTVLPDISGVKQAVLQTAMHSSAPLNLFINREPQVPISIDSSDGMWTYAFNYNLSADSLEVLYVSQHHTPVTVQALHLFSYKKSNSQPLGSAAPLQSYQFRQINKKNVLDSHSTSWTLLDIQSGDSLSGLAITGPQLSTWILDSLSYSNLVENGIEPSQYLYNSATDNGKILLHFTTAQTIAYVLNNAADSAQTAEPNLQLKGRLKLNP